MNRAYEVLSDPGLKKNYDMFGDRGVGTSAASDVEAGERMKKRNGKVQPDMTNYYDNDEFFGNVGGRKRYNSGPVDFETFSGQWDKPNAEENVSAKREPVDSGPWKRARRTPHVSEETVDFDWFGGSNNKKDGSRHRPYGPIIGDDIALHYEVDFKTAVMGGPVEITLTRFEKCGTCTGTGARPGTKKTTCTTCGGSGVAIPISRSGPVFSIACPDCRGTGEKIHDPCVACHGTAVQKKTSKVSVEIPAGVRAGNKIRVEGQGDVGLHAGPSGDLFLFLKVKDDPVFRREGNDIFSEVKVSCVDAILGTSTKVQVVDGEAEVTIPPGTQPGHVICIKKRGAPSLVADQRGDHFVTVEVEIPNGENDKDNQLVQLLKNGAGAKSSPPYFTKNADGAKGASENVRSPHNFSAPFPKTDNTATKDKAKNNKTEAVTPQSAASSTSATNRSTVIDKETLATLQGQAAKAEAAEKERIKFEKLAAERELELKEQANRLKALTEKAEAESKQRAHFEKIAQERETELKECTRRQVEMNKDITVRVRQSQGQTTRITVKKSVELLRIFEMVGRQRGIRPSDMKFTYNGKELGPTDTPLDLDMETNSLIDVTMRPGAGGVGSGVRYM